VFLKERVLKCYNRIKYRSVIVGENKSVLAAEGTEML
jgi:hypothetical protein